MSRAPARVATAPPAVHADGSPIPARLRIAAWITLATGVGLLAVVLTIRSSLLADVERDANAAIEQEVEEFRTFAQEGRDPTTGAPFESGRPLLELYLDRQSAAPDEVLAGWDPAAPAQEATLLQDGAETFGLDGRPEVLRELAGAEAASGTDTVDGEVFRWGRAVVEDDAGRPVAVFLVLDFLGPRQDEAAATVRLVVLVCLGGLLLTSLFAFAVAGAILAPVRAVRRAAAGITRTDLSRRIEVRGRDDVAALASSFNAMLDRLERSSRAQDHVVRIADRAIRGPLAVVGDDRAPDRDRRQAARQVTATLDAMGLLTASQLPGFVDPAPHDASDLARTLADRAREAAPDAAWSEELTARGPVVVDAELLGRAIAALARNAEAEHVGDRPLRLGVVGDQTHVEVWVEDDGPGLEESRAQHVLDRYTDLTEDDPGEGGLGLAVVRAVADAHEGSAWVETAPGQGARFGLRLPRRPPADLADARPQEA